MHRYTLSWCVFAIIPLSAQVCVKITPHRAYAYNIPSGSIGVYCCVVHAFCVRNGHTSSKPSQWFTCWAQVPTTVIIHVKLCIQQSRTSHEIAKYKSDIRWYITWWKWYIRWYLHRPCIYRISYICPKVTVIWTWLEYQHISLSHVFLGGISISYTP